MGKISVKKIFAILLAVCVLMGMIPGAPGLGVQKAYAGTQTNNALYFGANSSVTGLSGISPTAYTAEFNIYLDLVDIDWQGVYWEDRPQGYQTGIYVENDLKVSLWVAKGNGDYYIWKSQNPLNSYQWNHVALTYDGSNLKFYINGKLDQTYSALPGNQTLLPTTNVTMGYKWSLGNGALDNFEIWNTARTASQILADKDAEPVAPYPAALVRYYDFNHGVGGANNTGVTNLQDKTGNSAGGTLTNFTLNGNVSNWVSVAGLISKYTVTYVGNGNTSGSVPEDNNYYQSNTTVTVGGNTGGLAKDGCTFAGWNTQADGNGADRAAGSTFAMGTENVTLYAKWTEASLIAQYDFAGNLLDSLNGSLLTAFGTANDGYNHNNATSGFGTDDGINGDTTYWQWTSTLARGGGFWIDVNSNISSNYSVGVRFAYNSTGPSYKKIIDYKNSTSDNGFYFYGNGKLNYFPNSALGLTSVADNQIMDIVATRAADGTFTAYMVVDGTLYKELQISDTNGDAIPAVVNGKPRFGFFFDENQTAAEATSGGKVYSIKIWNKPITQDEVKTAMNTSIAYDGNGNTGGTAPVDNTKYTQGETVTVLGNTGNLTRTGYIFAGWNTQADGNGTNYNQGSTFVMGTANVVLYAKWTAIDPPAWIAGYPRKGVMGSTGGQVLVKTDKAGKAYYVVLADGAAAPSAAEVKAGSGQGGATPVTAGSITLAANTEVAIPLAGLASTTVYNVYVVAEDNAAPPVLQAAPAKVTVSTDILAYYKFDGNALDSSGNGNNGTASAGVSYAGGFAGQAASFNGTTGYIELPYDLIHSNPNFTLIMRFKTTGYGGLLGYQDCPVNGSASAHVPILSVNKNGKLYSELWIGRTEPQGGHPLSFTSSQSVNDGNWHKVALSATTTTLALYLDDVLVGSGGTSDTLNYFAMSYNQLGTNCSGRPAQETANGWFPYTGQIDECYITTKGMSNSDIQKLTNSLVLGSQSISEAAANDGSITATQAITLNNGTYAEDMSSGVTVNKLPAGLGIQITRNSSTKITIAFTGKATSHENANSVSNASVTVAQSKIVGATGDVNSGPFAFVFNNSVSVPAVSTADPVTAITATNATAGGNVTANGGAPILERGVVYKTGTGPVNMGNGTKAPAAASGTGAFTVNLAGLAPGTAYSVAAYATNAAGTAYGAVVSFNTLAPAPVVTTKTPATPISAIGASVGGTATGSGITAYGVLCATTDKPVLGTAGLIAGTRTGTEGAFTVSFTGLTPGTKYYARAYATNPEGTTYGEVEIFTTPSNNSRLSGVVLSQGTLSPAFAQDGYAYTAQVQNSVTGITILPTPADGRATVAVAGNPVANGRASNNIPLNVGANTINIVVTAQDGTSSTYTVTVTRKGSGDAALSGLSLAEGKITPVFNRNVTAYTATVGETVSTVNVTAVLSDANAAMTINGSPAASNAAKAVDIGSNNQITIVVTPQDNTAPTKTYTLTVLRENSLSFIYDDFSKDTDLLQINNDASINNKELQLTPNVTWKKGSAFYKKRLSLTNQRSFSTFFTFSMSGKGGSGQADGIVFTIQTVSNTAGSNGGGIGYQGLNPSVGIEFDSWYNSENKDLSSPHIGIDLNGNIVSQQKVLSPFDFRDGGTYYAWIDYDGPNKTIYVRISKTAVKPSSATLTMPGIDLSSILNMDEVYAGFTSATGGASQRHAIGKWYFNNDYKPIDTTQNTYVETPDKVTLEANPADMGATVSTSTLTAAVLRKDGSPAANVPVTFSTTRGILSRTQGMTDGSGKTTVTLQAAVNSGTATVKAVVQGGAYGELTLSHLKLTDADSVAADSLNTQIGYAAGDSEASVTKNVILPTAGENGTVITWTSDKLGTVTAAGTVTRPGYLDGDSTVTPTATISKGSESASKLFVINVKRAPYVEPVLTIGSAVISEAPANDGNITATQAVTITGGSIKEDITASDVKVNNLPSGLTATVTRNSATKLTVSFAGKAGKHNLADSVSSASITVAKDKLTGTLSDLTTGKFSISFRDPARLTTSNMADNGNEVDEAKGNLEPFYSTGSVVGTITVTLENGTFAGTVNPSLVTVNNLPAGLVKSVARISGTQLQVSFTGNAASHSNADDVNKASVTVGKAAITGALDDVTSSTFKINFNEPEPYMTVESPVLSEAAANDGSIAATQTVHLMHGTFGNSANGEVALSDVTAENLPSGLTVSAITLDSSTQFTVRFGGKAAEHLAENSVNNIILMVNGSKVTPNDPNLSNWSEAVVSGSFGIRFINPPPSLRVGSSVIREAADRDATITDTQVVNLSNGTFAADLTGGVFINNLPEGLGFAVAKDSETQMTITFTGKALSQNASAANASITIAQSKIIGAEDSVTSDTFAILCPSDAGIAYRDGNELKIVYAEGDSASSVTWNVGLPSTGGEGSTVTWSSDAPGTISSEGTVARPGFTTGDKTVTLTAAITKGTDTETRTFVLTVKKLGITDDEAIALDLAAIQIGYAAGDSSAKVTQNVSLAGGGEHNTSITWASSESGVITNEGLVTRPASANKAVTLTATVSKGGGTPRSVTFELNVIKKAGHTVTFISNGGSEVAAQTVAENAKASAPAVPVRNGFTFGGWYTDDAAFKNAYNFETPVTADINLYAKWIENAPVLLPGLSTASAFLEEAEANDGSVGGAQTVTLSNGTFAADMGDGVTVNNLPAGLGIQVSRDGDTQITIRFTGNALRHELDNSVADASVTVKKEKIGGAAGDITSNPFGFSFRNRPSLSVSMAVAEEAAPYAEGLISTTPVSVALVNGAFAADLSGGVTVNNLPEGLGIQVERQSDTQIDILFTGNALKHTNEDDVLNASVTVARDKIVGATGDVTSNTFKINFNDPEPLFAVETPIMAESAANDGSIPGTQRLTLLYGEIDPGITAADVIAENLPAGLGISITRAGSTQLDVAFTGKADGHTDAESVQTIRFAVAGDRITSTATGTTAAGAVYSNSFAIDFIDPYPVVRIGSFLLEEAESNDGSFPAVQVVTVTNGSFASDMSGGVTVNNLPEGLGIEVRRDGDTQITISFTGNAKNHTGAYDTGNASVTIARDKISGAAGDITSGIFAFHFINAKPDSKDDYDRLNIQYANGDDADHVTKSVFLAGKGASGKTTILWTTSDPGHITATGRVTRPGPEEADVSVTLTAAITDNNTHEQRTKTFTLRVLKLSDAEAVQDAAKQLTGQVAFTFTGSDTWECVTSQFVLLTSGAYGTSISWSSSNTGVIAIVSESGSTCGRITRPESEDVNVILTATITKDSRSITKTFLLVVKNTGVTKETGNTRQGTTRDADVTVNPGGAATTRQVEILRTTLDDNTKIDTVVVTADKVESLTDTINPQEADDSRRTVNIAMTQPADDKADELAVEIPATAVDALSDKNALLQIRTDEGSIKLDTDSVKALAEQGTDLYFRIVPIQDAAAQDSIKNQIKNDNTVKLQLTDKQMNTLGIPRMIETNYTGIATKIVLPFAGITIPAENRQTFLEGLRIYIQHSDGTTEFITGTIVDGNGNPAGVNDLIYGIEFQIDKFSSFQLVSLTTNPSNDGDSHETDNDDRSDNGKTAADPAKDILGDSKIKDAVEVVKNPDGSVKIVVIDEKIRDLIKDEKQGAQVVIPVTGDAKTVTVALGADTVKELTGKGASLVIETDNGTVTIPASEIKLDSLIEALGKLPDRKEVTISIAISASDAETAKKAMEQAEKLGAKVVMNPINIEITASYHGKTARMDKFDHYITSLIPVPSGVDPAKITTAVYVDAQGGLNHVPTFITLIDGRYYAKINCFYTGMHLFLIWNPIEFKDAEKHWAKADVNDMSSRLVISGVSKTSFEPDRDITRAEFAAMIVRALGLRPGEGENSFNDVGSDAWYCGYVQTAYKYGIIAGYGHGKFGPEDKITREQAMAMIARTMKLTGLKAELKAEEADKMLAAFRDSGKAAAWARAPIAACVKAGIIFGNGKGSIAPKDAMTRAEVAAIAKRLLRKSDLIN